MSEVEDIVLVVEDDPALRAMLTMASEPWAFAAIIVATAAEARQFISSANQLCAVVTDYTLQDGTGLDVVRAVRERWPSAGAIITSGHRDLPLGGDAVAVLTKPFTLRELEKTILDACAVANARNPAG